MGKGGRHERKKKRDRAVHRAIKKKKKGAIYRSKEKKTK